MGSCQSIEAAASDNTTEPITTKQVPALITTKKVPGPSVAIECAAKQKATSPQLNDQAFTGPADLDADVTQHSNASAMSLGYTKSHGSNNHNRVSETSSGDISGGDRKTSTIMVVESWKEVKEIDDYEDVAGVLLFRKIFEIAPGADALFKFAIDGVDDDMYTSPLFLVHARGVIRTIDAAINLLETGNMDKLVEVLKRLGARHATYNVREVHYPIVGEALLDTLGKALGEGFTPDVKEAWTGVYGIITDTMCQGADEW